MRLCCYLLAALLILSTEEGKIFYGSGSVLRLGTEVDEEKNHVCNGDFEDPPITDGKPYVILKSTQLPCWVATKNMIRIGYGPAFVDTMKTQVMNLAATDPKVMNQGHMQAVTLTEGQYILKFDYAPRQSFDPEVSTFFVYFNGIEIAKIRPSVKGVKTLKLSVQAEEG